MSQKKEICKIIRKSLDIAECPYDSAKIRKIVDHLEQSFNFDKMNKFDLKLMETTIIVCVEVLE